MSIYRRAMSLHFREQMRRARRSNSLRGEMAPDVEISRILPFLDRLMVRPRFPHRFLLGVKIFIQRPVARIEFGPDALDIFIHDSELCLRRREFLFGQPNGVCAAESGPGQFCAFLRQPGPARRDVG